MGGLVEAKFIHRLNRFASVVELNGKEALVHIANSGRMGELFVEGHRVLLQPTAGEHRKTAFDLALVENGTGLFPDSPTTPGVKHMTSLSKSVTCGHRAAVVLVVQLGDAIAFISDDKADPEFGEVLGEAVAKGVEVYAYGCSVTTNEIVLSDPLPIRL